MLYIIISHIWSICKIKTNSWHPRVCLSYTSRSPASPQNSLRSFRGAPQARRDKHTPAPQTNEKQKSQAERSRKGTVARSRCAHAMQGLATLRGTWGTESWFEETQTPSETLNPCSRQRKTHSKDNRALTMQSLATLQDSESRNEFSKKQRRYCVAVPSLLFGDPSESSKSSLRSGQGAPGKWK